MYKKAAVLSGRTFLTSLVTDQHIFADEIDKFHFLKTLKGILDPPGYSGIAFVLTDSELHLVLNSKADDIDPDERILNGFNQVFLPYYEHRHACSGPPRVRVRAVPLFGTDQLVENSIRLHLLPRREGYVDWAADYWWSSAQMYLGHYCWDFIDQELLLSTISYDSGRARKELTRIARKAYLQEFGKNHGYNR